LELGGNNAIIVTPDDIKMTVIGAVLELWELQDKDVLQPVV
jgi:acyl-CoA reductase-like NAD-dependent aldehyde dehydrogenase